VISELPEAAFLLCLLLLTTVGWGAAIHRAASRALPSDPIEGPSIGLLGIVGLFAVGVVALIVNFVLPLGGLAAWCIAGIGVAFAGLFHRSIVAGLGPHPALNFLILVAVAAIALVFVPAAPFHSDAGLYHLQAMRWAREEPMVLGLANVHGRLGFNSIWHLIAVPFWLPGFGLAGVVLSPAVPAIFLLQMLARHLVSTAERTAMPRAACFAAVGSIFLLAYPGLLLFARPVSSDQLPALMTVAAVFFALRLVDLDRSADPRSDGQARQDRLSLLACVGLAVTSKLSAIVLLALVIGAFFSTRPDRARRSFLLAIMVVGIAPGALWAVRSVALSGCVAYPVAATCATGLPWAVGADRVEREAQDIRGWARLPRRPAADRTAAIGTLDWVSTWVNDPRRGDGPLPRALAGTALLTAGAAGLYWLLAVSRGAPRRRSGPSAAEITLIVSLALTIGGGIAFWFASAPDPRFAIGLLTVLAAAPATYLLHRAWRRLPIASGLRVAAALCVIGVAVHLAARPATQLDDWSLARPAEIPDLARHRTPDGTIVHAPADGKRCWLAPLPCMPRFDDSIEFGQLGLLRIVRSTRGQERRRTPPSGRRATDTRRRRLVSKPVTRSR